MSRVDEFIRLLQDIEDKLRAAKRSPIEAAVDDFELAGALDLLKRFLASGNLRDLNEGIDRLTRVFTRRNKGDREQGRSSLARLRTLGEEMTQADRENALDVPDAASAPHSANKGPIDPARCDLLVVAALYEPELSAFLRRISNLQQLIGS